MKIIQLITRHPSFPGGINQYSLILAEQLWNRHNIFTHFLGYSDLENPKIESHEVTVNGFPSTNLFYKESTDILEVFSSLLTEGVEAIIFHYIPKASWLLKCLHFLKKKYRFQLVVMFHDGIYVPRGIKKNISYEIRQFLRKDNSPNSSARELTKIADTILTTTYRYQMIISKWVKYPVICIPIYSTIGEPQSTPPLVKRSRRMIVFGKPYLRKRVYEKAINQLVESCYKLEIKEINDIGPLRDSACEVILPKLSGIDVVEIGEESSVKISQIMLTSLAGFIDYDPSYLSKSSVLAAYCAHGLIPLCSRYTESASDGLELNQNYLCCHKFDKLDCSQLQYIADSATAWYRNHDIKTTTDIFASILIK
ncbi:MAG: hypothetical protein RH949_26160 [Coleofasciculus sp. A1-SPW-01]|uniref:hypothetical protein n=1 Tax=Coleofasciculus sp. A1-SPW-01 TaxID=3070819 RepID=UPI0032FAA2B7